MKPSPQPRPIDDPRNGPVWLRGELLAEGWNDQAIRAMVRDGSWEPLRRGAYTGAEAWRSLDESGRHGLRARAVLRQARTDVVLSHASALPEYDAPVRGIDLSHVHVTRLDGRAGRVAAGVNQHCGVVEEGDVIELNGVPVMAPARAALELTTQAGTEAALCVVNDLLHKGWTTPEELRAFAARMDHWPGSLRTGLVLRLADPRIESVGETRTFYLCFRQGLPAPVPQYVVRDGSGQEVARLDFAWPELRTFVEFDGRFKYEALLRPGQRASDVVVAEKEREKLVCHLTGWRCVRLTWADLDRPQRTAELIRSTFWTPRRSA